VVLGQAPLQSTGIATLSVSNLALGTYTINASYSGDALDTTSSTTAALTQTVGAAAFTISAIPASQTVTVGQDALYVIGIQPEGNYTSAITLSCNLTTLPTDSTCTFTPSTATPGTTSTTVSLSINTVAPTTSRLLPPPGSSPIYRFGAFGGLLAALAILCALLSDSLRKQKRGAFVRFAMAVTLVISMGMALASCHKTTTTTTAGTETGEFVVTVTGTGNVITSESSTTVTVTVDAATTSSSN
jgi:hypothetical protein